MSASFVRTLCRTLPAALALLAACGGPEKFPVDKVSGLRVPELGPVPALPEWPDNPPTDAKKKLGHALFADTRLSGSGHTTCGNCHFSPADFQSATPLDAPDRSYPNLTPTLPRHTPSLLNIVYATMLRWDGSHFTDLYDVAVLPFAEPNMNASRLTSANADEVDVEGAQQALYTRFTVDVPGYVQFFQDAFAEDIRTLTPKETWRLAGKALAVYFRIAVSRDSAFDRWNAGDATAMNAAQVRGLELFRGRAQCERCHSGPMFTDYRFHNVSTSAPAADGKRPDEGRFRVTGVEADRGAFLTPTLRSVSMTSPYLHDGSETTLAAVIRKKTSDDGRKDPLHDDFLNAAQPLGDGDVDDLVQFLKALKGAPLPPSELNGLPTLP